MPCIVSDNIATFLSFQRYHKLLNYVNGESVVPGHEQMG